MAVAERQYRSVAEVADHLGVSERTIYRAVARGDLHAIRLNPAGGAFRIAEEELRRLAESRRS